MKHTPRPWRLLEKGLLVEVLDGDGSPIVNWQGFDDSGRSSREHSANAVLIAAAPDLLVACEEIASFSFDAVSNSDGYDEALEQWAQIKRNARLAIAKARGE